MGIDYRTLAPTALGGGAMKPPPSETYYDGFIDYRTLAPTALGGGAMTPPSSETYPEIGGGGGAMTPPPSETYNDYLILEPTAKRDTGGGGEENVDFDNENHPGLRSRKRKSR